ncbi:MAG: hypothetical protein IJR97_01980 [Clostridia bacterium]|nr:hypothetical protein [Clostridia bacterium]
MRSVCSLSLFLAFILCLPLAAAGEGAPDGGAYTLIPEAEQRMRYDCVSFADAWPQDIRDAMEACFPGAAPVRGIYCVWQPLAGDEMPFMFAACVTDGREALLGAWADGGTWRAQIISDRFFRPGQVYGIGMKPDHDAQGRVTLYQPAVRYDGEWFVFQPVRRDGFRFAYYERETSWAEDCPENTSMVVQILESRDASGRPETYFTVSSHRIGDFKYEIWRGRISDNFDTDMIDASTFPVTLEEVFALCEPNG